MLGSRTLGSESVSDLGPGQNQYCVRANGAPGAPRGGPWRRQRLGHLVIGPGKWEGDVWSHVPSRGAFMLPVMSLELCSAVGGDPS